MLLLLVSTLADGVVVALPAAYGMNSRQFVPRSDYERVLGIFSADIHEFRRQIDGLVSQEP